MRGPDLVEGDSNYRSTWPILQLVAKPPTDPGVMSLILARFHSFAKIDHKIISAVTS